MNSQNKVYALLVEPDQKPKITQIEVNEQAIKNAVGGEYASIEFPDDEVEILYNRNGVKDGHTLNRVIQKTEIYERDMPYSELKALFRQAENEGRHLAGYVTFTEDSFDKKYPLASRTYVIGSNNKAFQSGMGGYSIYASSVDKSDPLVRLERYMRDEQGGSDGWKIERCYIREVTPLVNMIVADNFLVCYAPSDKNIYEDIPQELVDKYFKEFEKPDKFYRKTNGEIAVIRENRRQKKDMER